MQSLMIELSVEDGQHGGGAFNVYAGVDANGRPAVLDFASPLNGAPPPGSGAPAASLPGVGPKTAACVLLFSLGRPALPVDTHIHRVAKRLGLVPEKSSAEQARDLLEPMLEPEQIYPFHIQLIKHGRRTCTARRPECPSCPLRQRCPSATTFHPELS